MEPYENPKFKDLVTAEGFDDYARPEQGSYLAVLTRDNHLKFIPLYAHGYADDPPVVRVGIIPVDYEFIIVRIQLTRDFATASGVNLGSFLPFLNPLEQVFVANRIDYSENGGVVLYPIDLATVENWICNERIDSHHWRRAQSNFVIDVSSL